MIKSGFFERNLKYLFPLPALLFVLLLMVFPVLYTLFVSFTDWTLTSGRPMKFAGLGSYLKIMGEPRFLDAVGRTFYFTIGAVLAEAVLGTTIALVLNYILSVLGLPQSGWVTASSTVLPSLMLVDIWQWTPMISLIVLAGLAGLSNEPYESAKVDGATSVQTFVRITLPMVMPTILTAIILRAVDALKTYDIIYAMTGGGPGYSSETLNILAYKFSFEYFNMGQASSILVFLFFIVLLFSIGVTKIRKLFEL